MWSHYKNYVFSVIHKFSNIFTKSWIHIKKMDRSHRCPADKTTCSWFLCGHFQIEHPYHCYPLSSNPPTPNYPYHPTQPYAHSWIHFHHHICLHLLSYGIMYKWAIVIVFHLFAECQMSSGPHGPIFHKQMLNRKCKEYWSEVECYQWHNCLKKIVISSTNTTENMTEMRKYSENFIMNLVKIHYLLFIVILQF